LRDEEVAVGSPWPPAVPVLRIGRRADAHGIGEQNRAIRQEQPTVVKVGGLQGAQLPRGERTEDDQCRQGRMGKASRTVIGPVTFPCVEWCCHHQPSWSQTTRKLPTTPW